MKVVITGGGGFLGNQLARQLIKRGELTAPSGQATVIDEILLFDTHLSDAAKSGLEDHPQMSWVTGDISDRDQVSSLIDRDDISVFHLASMVSGECEVRFDDAININLDGQRHLLEACRARISTPRLVFTSSIAAFGGEVMPETVSDSTKRTPQTTYGMTKVIGELLINDYSRKGFIDGRSARLPTIIIRPGKPNTAASSFASGVLREPLAGQTCELPVDRAQLMPVLGYRDVIDSFIALHEAKPDVLGDDRAYGLPSIQHSVAEMIENLEEAAASRNITLGPIIDSPDETIRRIVATWPTATDGARALKIGVPPPSTLMQIIDTYIDDFM
ncbi:MAG: NAD-dependent epimerase/dehydratase family protein [Verrucomicrobiota bacterium]